MTLVTIAQRRFRIFGQCMRRSHPDPPKGRYPLSKEGLLLLLQSARTRFMLERKLDFNARKTPRGEWVPATIESFFPPERARPFVRRKTSGNSMLRCGAWLAALSFWVGIAGCGSKHNAAEAAKADAAADNAADDALPVFVEAAQARTMIETVDGLGRCEALPDRIATLTPAIEGRVKEILLKLGEGVKTGQPVVQLDTTIADANLADKTAARDGANASLALLQAPPRAAELKSQELAVEQAKAAHEKARLAAERLRPLAERKEISAAQMYEADNGVKQAELQERAAEAQLAVLKLKPRAEAVAETTSRVKTAEAAVKTAQAQLKLHTLTSPIEGTLDSLACRLGQTITVGTPVGEIVDTRKLHVVIWLPARDAARVRVGQKARVRVGGPASRPEDKAESNQPDSTSSDAAKADSATTADATDNPPLIAAPKTETAGLSGTVAFVGRAADSQTGNLPVRILVENPDGRLHLGQSAWASITVNEKANALAIPKSACFDVGTDHVFSIVRDGKSVRAHPDLGLRDKHWVEVTGEGLSDLKPGELIIVEGGYNLPEGNKVKPLPAPTEKAR